MSIEELIKQRQQNFLDQAVNSGDQREEIVDRKSNIYQRVRSRISDNRDLFLMKDNEDLQYIRNQIWKLIEDEIESNRAEWLLTSYERAEVLEQIMHSMFGYGVIEPFINDPDVTEIMVNGTDKIFIEKGNQVIQAKDRRGLPLKFKSREELMHVIEKIVAPLNRKINESDPIVDARLPNGSRVNVVLSPISLDGASLTIRKFPDKPYTLEQLVALEMCTDEVAQLLRKLVASRYNILISGGTGSGKTTFLNALSMYIPPESRLITIEDAAELKLAHAENMIRLEMRPANIEGKGEITIRDLVRTSLRMRPDRIIVGEVRGGEALDMLQAMNTGHEGSLSTGHANSAEDLLSRLETMVLMAGIELPLTAIRQQIASAVDLIIHLSKMRDGVRRIVEIIEVLNMDKGVIKTSYLYKWNESASKLEPTGAKIRANAKLINAGYINHSS